mgnify:CR=1 FL=1
MAMCSMEICYRLSNGSDERCLYVFPSLLPVLDPTEASQVFARNTNADSRTVFGRRFVLQDARGFPPTFLLHLFRRLHALVDRVALVRQDHFFFVLFGMEVMVRFNTSPVGIRSSSGSVALSLDLAVCAASPADMDQACWALDRAVLELALTLTSDAQFPAVRLAKYGFTSRRPSDDYRICQPETDAILGSLVWADPLASEPSTAVAAVTVVPEQHFAGGQGAVSNPARVQFLADVEQLRNNWLDGLVSGELRSRCEPISPAEFVALFERDFVGLLCDPFWVLEVLPAAAPPCLLKPPRRFGHLPTELLPTLSTTAAPEEAQSSNVFADHSVSVLDEPVAAGRFGSGYYRGLDLGGFQNAMVIRAIKASCQLEELVSLVSEYNFTRVVHPVLPCKHVATRGWTLLALDARAFELTLTEALADTSVDERTWRSLLVDVATGLHELHSHGLVHGRLTIERSVVVSRAPVDATCPFVGNE